MSLPHVVNLHDLHHRGDDVDPQHWEFPARTSDPDAVRRWFAARAGDGGGAAGIELYNLVVPGAGETIRLVVTRAAGGRVRVAVYGRRPLAPAVLRAPGWCRLRFLADTVGVAADGAGAWAELPM